MSKRSIHVITSGSGWAVRRRGAIRATKTFSRREDAVDFARDIAKKSAIDLFVHRPNGMVERYDSFRETSAH